MDNKSKMDGVVNQMVAVNTNDLEREREVGIVHYVNPEQKGFSGVLKQRYVFIESYLCFLSAFYLDSVCLQMSLMRYRISVSRCSCPG